MKFILVNFLSLFSIITSAQSDPKLIKKILALLLIASTFCNPLSAESFDYFRAYRIHELHRKGFTGQGYSVSIIESNADENHPALKGKVEIIDPTESETGPMLHGNHVSALIVGNRNENFIGGVAPDAKGYVIRRPKSMRGDAKDDDYYRREHASNELKVLEEAAKKSHIINWSGSAGSRLFPSNRIGKDYTDAMKKILEENDAILVITATNDFGEIGKLRNADGEVRNPEARLLVAILQDRELCKRVLIVGNLKFVSESELNETYESLKDWKETIKPKMASFHVPDELASKIAKIKNLKASWDSKFDEIKDQNKLGEYIHFRKESALKLGIVDLDKFKKETLEEIELALFKHLVSGSLKLNDRIVAALAHSRLASMASSIVEGETIESILAKVGEKVDDNLLALPMERNNSGVPATASAGLARDHFILTYGTDINSAWGSPAQSFYRMYSIESGSSQAAPITTGILILLHQHLYQNKSDTKGSWKELLSYVKTHSRKIGPANKFGLGMLDTSLLFRNL